MLLWFHFLNMYFFFLVKLKGFVVHKSRGVTTLSSMQEPLVPARLRPAKEKSNVDTKADERGLLIHFFFLFFFFLF